MSAVANTRNFPRTHLEFLFFFLDLIRYFVNLSKANNIVLRTIQYVYYFIANTWMSSVNLRCFKPIDITTRAKPL